MSTVDLIETHRKFHWKQSTLKIWAFGPGAQGSNCHIRTINWLQMKLCMDLWNMENGFRIYLMWWTKPINIFRNGGGQIFSQIWQANGIFQKSRQIWTKKLNRGSDWINKGGKKFKYILENFIVPYPFESGTFTNWWNWNQTKPRPEIDLPAKLGILVQFQANFG